MKFRKFSPLILSLIVILYQGATSSARATHEDFVTGESYFKQGKDHYEQTVAGQFRPRHQAMTEMDFLSLIGTLEKENNLRRPFHLKFTSAGDGISLILAVSQGHAMELNLFLAINEAFVDIFDTGSYVYQNAKYLRADLEKARTYFAQAALFLKGAQYICDHVLKGEEGTFHEDRIMKNMRNTSYTPASEINEKISAFVSDRVRYHDSKVSVAEYIAYYSSVYYDVFVNSYHYIDAHLSSKEAKTRMMLNRKQEGGLKDFTFELTTARLLDMAKLPVFTEEEKEPQALSAPSNKKKRRKKKRNPSSASVASEALLVTASQDPCDVSLPEKSAPAAQVDALALTPLAQQVAQSSSTDAVTPVRPVDEEIEPVISSTGEQAVQAPIDAGGKGKERDTVNAISAPRPQTHQGPSRLQRLNALLDEHDGGPHAGMKPRKFLRLCAALNDAGYFSGFTANQKEVRVKTDQSVSVLHIEKHSANRRSPGVSANTARKLQEIIEGLKQNQSTS
ncbi:MAG: hypothetical protein C0514_08595 [Candidatus Puniceispirillum sp.]|nr:hypothetical protein [Candidatus Puniceispirillum sp.]